MTTKVYNQYCAIAHTLDIVGERWSLLIIRNLLVAPQRFSDLLKGLPGISTNILTDRLKALEKHQVITTRYLLPPAASTVYELTKHGQGLTEALVSLARWGSVTLGEYEKEQIVVKESVYFMLQGVFWRNSYLNIELSCNVQIEDKDYTQTFGITLSSKGIWILEPLSEPDIEIRTGLASLNLLSSQRKHLEDLVATNTVKLQGNREKIKSLYLWLAP